MEYLGIDIGGSGIKGAIVDTDKGILTVERIRIETPDPAMPNQVAEIVAEISTRFNYNGPMGVGFPAAIQNGIVKTASNIDNSWIDVDADALFKEITGNPTITLNDADVAGLAEMKYGAGKDESGVVLLITVGTGIGTVIFSHGELVPNTELGHLYLQNGTKAELFASDAVRKNEGLKWKQWAKRFNKYLVTMENLFWPDLIILGGGASKKFHKYSEHLSTRTVVVPAELLNEAGIIGAALAAQKRT